MFFWIIVCLSVLFLLTIVLSDASVYGCQYPFGIFSIFKYFLRKGQEPSMYRTWIKLERDKTHINNNCADYFMGENTNYFKDSRDDLTGIVIPFVITVQPQWYRPKQTRYEYLFSTLVLQYCVTPSGLPYIKYFSYYHMIYIYDFSRWYLNYMVSLIMSCVCHWTLLLL